MFDRKRTVRVRGRQSVTGRVAAGAGGRLRVVHDVMADAVLDERDALLGHALVVERHRQARRIAAVVPDRHEAGADLAPGLRERAPLLHRQGGEAQVAQHVQDVDDRVFLEHDRIVARLERYRIGRCAGLLRRIAAECRGIDPCRVHGRRLGIAAPAVGRHRDRDELAGGADLAGPDAVRVDDGERLRACRERAVGHDTRGVRCGDHLADRVGPEFRGRVRRSRREGLGHIAHGRGLGQTAPVIELGDAPRDRRRLLDQRPQALLVGSSRRRHRDPSSDSRSAG